MSNGFRTAINAKCKECIYDPHGCRGTWREQVQNCTSYNCPLWPLRPTTQARQTDKAQIFVRSGCTG